MSIPAGIINKRVSFDYLGKKLYFNLSQSLFSSFDIDAGSKLLLKTLATGIDFGAYTTLLDMGCGVGILGIALKKIYPHLKLVGIDRDALAICIARENAGINAISGDFRGVLATDPALLDLGRDSRSFVVANLPAKAGLPVLDALIKSILRIMSSSDLAAVVIVRTLTDALAGILAGIGAGIVQAAYSREHTVFHFGGAGVSPGMLKFKEHDFLKPYIRYRTAFKAYDIDYELSTVYNLPDFDEIGFDSQLAMRILTGIDIPDRIIFWKPGQGHIPLFTFYRKQKKSGTYVLAGRDLLSLKICRKNLLDAGVKERSIICVHTTYYGALKEKADLVICIPDVDPGTRWYENLLSDLARLLSSSGRLLLVSKSTHVARSLKKNRHFTSLADKKMHGYRAVLLKKKKGNF